VTSHTVEPDDRLANGLIRQRAVDGYRHSLALLSPDLRHRLLLLNDWPGGDGRTLTAVMLNPSTADALSSDATWRRVCGYARREGCSAAQALNLFTLRATQPRDLLSHSRDERVDERADSVIADSIGQHPERFVLVGWGEWAAHSLLRPRRLHVVELLRQVVGAAPLFCLGSTASGEPVHPLRQRADAQLVEWAG
jgi:hypothetical protein